VIAKSQAVGGKKSASSVSEEWFYPHFHRSEKDYHAFPRLFAVFIF